MLDCLAYSEDSPSGLVWIKSRGSARKGSIAGNYDSEYWRVGRRERILAHRIIWELVFGKIPDGCIVDHKDGDKTNNKISNLRVIPFEHNVQNCAMFKNNSSGYTGVKYRLDYDSWVATWSENGQGKAKSFSTNKWGEGAKTMAIEYRKAKIEELTSKGAAYTERHGKSIEREGV